MLQEIYQNLPLHLSPVAFTIGSFAVRWYALSYIVGFTVVYFLLRWRIKNDEHLKVISHRSSVIAKYDKKNDYRLPITDYYEFIFDFLLLSFFASLIGGRIGYVIFYNWQYFIVHPLAIISPFQNGNFVGYFGMSFHGALVAVLLASLFYLRRMRMVFLSWADFVIPAIPLGYFFGRLGNFFNGELYGRITSSRWGMRFLEDPYNLRYPSQLFEALFEGLLLFLFLWKLRNSKFKKGTLLSFYLIGYGAMRGFCEFFREPDPQLGFIFAHITMGQILSIVLLVCGLVLLFLVNAKKCYNEKSKN